MIVKEEKFSSLAGLGLLCTERTECQPSDVRPGVLHQGTRYIALTITSEGDLPQESRSERNVYGDHSSCPIKNENRGWRRKVGKV